MWRRTGTRIVVEAKLVDGGAMHRDRLSSVVSKETVEVCLTS